MIKVKYDNFYPYEELQEYLEQISNLKKDLCKLTILAQTEEKRNIYLMEVTDFSTGEASKKPAYYIQANVHASEGAGTVTALHIIESLVMNPEHKELLKKVAFYIVPRANPDGGELAQSTHAPIRSRFEITDRKNGLVPKDINGDGYILSMRWQDPAGPYVEDEVDNRLMVTRRPGDRGPFYQVYTEGMINDYDGTGIVNGYKNIDFNRNYPLGWAPELENSGKYPFSEREIKSIADFLISHPNVFAAMDLHCGTPAIIRPSYKRDDDMDQGDLEKILIFGKMAENMTGFPLMKTKDYRQPWRKPVLMSGCSKDWFHYNLGIFAYSIELGWGFSTAGIYGDESFVADARTRETVFMRKILQFHDSKNSTIFTPWEEFEHTQLGKIEVGGLMTGYGRFMYPPEMEQTSPKVKEFILEHAKYHPDLLIHTTEVKNLKCDMYRIRATVSNVGGLSTNIMNDVQNPDCRTPVRVKITSENKLKVLSRVTNFEIDVLKEFGGSYKLEWFIEGQTGDILTIEASHPKAGVTMEKLKL